MTSSIGDYNNNISFIRKALPNTGISWLSQGHPMGAIDHPVSLDLLAIICSDSFIKGTNYDGFQHKPLFTFFHKFLEKINELELDWLAPYKNELISLQKDFQDSLEIFKELDPKTCDIEASAKKLFDSFMVKKRGLFPAGWNNNNGGGQAMVLHIDMDHGFTIINSGSGIEYFHPCIQDSSLDPLTGGWRQETKYQKSLKVTAKNKERFQSPAFFQALIELMVLPVRNSLLNFNSNHIYTSLVNFVEGNFETPADPYSHPECYTKPQRSGTCAAKSITSMIYSRLCKSTSDIPIYKKLKLHWQLYLLVTFCKNIKTLTFEEARLLKDTTRNILRAAEKLQDAESDNVLDTIKECEERIDHYTFKPKPVYELPSCEWNGPEETRGFKCKIETEILCTHQLEQDKNIAIFSNSKLYSYHLILDDPKKCLEDLKVLFKPLIETPFLLDGVQLSLQIEEKALENFFLKLPIPLNNKECYWENVPEENIADIMEQLDHLGARLLHCEHAIQKKSFCPKMDIMLQGLYTLNWILAQRLTETKLQTFSPFNRKFLNKCLSPDFTIDDPVWHEWTLSLLKYHYPQFTYDTFTEIKTGEEIYEENKKQLFDFSININEETIKERSNIENITLRYFKQFLRDPEVQNKFYDHCTYFDFSENKERAIASHDPLVIQLKVFLSEALNKDSPLPKSVQYLVQSSLRMQTTHGIFSAKNKEEKVTHLKMGGKPGFYKRESLSFCSEIVSKLGPFHEYYRKGHLLSSKLTNHELYRKTPNELVSSHHSILSLGPLDSLEYKMISRDPYDEVNRAIAFFHRHIPLLEKTELQRIFRLHLFRPGRLLLQLKTTPQIIPAIVTFFEDAIAHFRHIESLDVTLWLLTLSHDIQHFINKFGLDGSTLPNVRNIILNELLKKPEDKIKCFQTVVETYSELTVENSRDLSLQIAKDSVTLLFLTKNKNSSRANNVLFHLLPEIFNKYQDSDFINQVLNHATEQITGDSNIYEWGGSFPVFFNKKYKAHLETGVISENGVGEFIQMPHSIRVNHFQKFFNEPILSCLRYDNKTLINQGEANEVEVEEIMKDHLYQIFRRKIGEKTYRFAYQNRIQGVQLWQEENSSKGLVINSGKVVQTFETINDRLVIQDRKGNTFMSGDLSFSDLTPLFYMDYGQVNCWVSPENKIIKIIFNNLNLEFTGDGHTLYCKQVPGYFLIKNYSLMGVSQAESYLTLSNEKGEHKVLVKIDRTHYEEFEVQQNHLIPNRLQPLVLLNLYCKSHHYEKAYDLFNTLEPLERYSGEIKIRILFILNNLEEDHHPAAVALFLKIKASLLLNRLKYPRSIGKVSKASKSINVTYHRYKAYLANIANMTCFRLSQDEEKLIIEYLKIGFPDDKSFNDRERHLLEGRGVLTRKLCSSITLFQSNKPENPFKFNQKIEDINLELENPTLFNDKFYFEENFQTLYLIAIQGTEENRKKLKTLLDLNVHHNSEYVTALTRVLANPKAFPTYAQMVGIATFDRKLSLFYPKYWQTLMIAKNLFNLGMDYFGRFSALTQSKHFVRWVWPKETICKKEQNEVIPLNCKWQTLKHENWDSVIEQFFIVETTTPHRTDKKLPQKYTKGTPAVNKLVNQALEFEREEAETYLRETSVQSFAWNPDKSESDLRVILVNEKERLQSKLLNRPQELLAKVPLTTLHDLGQGKRLTWKGLQKLTLSLDFSKFQKKTHLTKEEAENLIMEMAHYLMEICRLNQIELALKLLEQGKRENVGAILAAKRHYRIDEETIENLWFESVNHFYYKKEQIEKMDEILGSDQQEQLAEMPTGFGKTKALVPSLNYKKGKTGVLVCNTWPSSLEKTNALDGQMQMQNAYGTRSDRLLFGRATKITSRTLRHIYQELKKDKAKGRPVNMRSESIRALELHFGLLLSGEVAMNEEVKKQLYYFIQIQRLFRTGGTWNSIDESHFTLDPTDQLIYTLGNHRILCEEEVTLTEKIFDHLSDHLLLGIRNNAQQYITEETFNTVICPELIKLFVDEFHIEDPESFRNFILNKAEVIPDWIATHPKRHLLALLKGQLCLILKDSLSGAVDVNFGLSKLHIETKEFAISYVSSNTPKETEMTPSQFKNPIKTLNTTYLTYLTKGLMVGQITKFLEFLKNQALLESKTSAGLENTWSAQFFKKIAPEYPTSLLKLSEKDSEALHKIFSHNKSVIFYYIKHIVVPQIKIYDRTLVSTVQNFRSQFPASLSLSATPQNTHAHGPNTHFIPMRGTSGKVTHLLLSKVGKENIHIIDGCDPKIALNQTLKLLSENPRVHAVMDVGAQFKGINNQDVAKKLCEHISKDDQYLGVLYFDEAKGVFEVMNKDGSTNALKPENLISYFDQNRCFGSDAKHPLDAKGLLLSGKETTKAAAGQGAGRMRQWDQNQTVDPCIPSEIQQIIFGDREPNIEDLLLYWIANDATHKAEMNYQSQMQQMDNEIRRALLDKILGIEIGNEGKIPDSKPSPNDALSYFKYYDELFIHNDESDTYKLYSALPQDIDPRIALKEHHARCVAKLKDLLWITNSEKKIIEERLNSYLPKWESMPLPEKVSKGSQLSLQCEVLEEIEVQMETQMNTQTQYHIEVRDPAIWPESLDLYGTSWEKPYNQLPFYKKIARLISIGLINPIRENIGKLSQYNWTVIGCGAAIALVSLIAHKLFSIIAIPLAYRFIIRPLYNRTAQNKVLKEVIKNDFLSENLLVTNNFLRTDPIGLIETTQKPFDSEQKPVFLVLVVKDLTKLQVILIDQNDSKYFARRLIDDPGAEGRSRKIALFDPQQNMITIEGKNRFGEGELQNDPQFQGLIAEVKLLNGFIDFNPMQLDHISKKSKKQKESFSKLYEGVILAARPDYRTAYPKTPLAKVLAIK